MKVSQFKYRQHTGVATVFKAENEEETAIIQVLKELIEDEKGALSRKCFTFDLDTDSMSIDMEKYKENARRFKAKKAATAEKAAAAEEPVKPKRTTSTKTNK